MKKALFLASLLAAALSFVGCNKEADFFGRNGRKMQIVLSDVDTRTVNNGLSTKWVDGDALNVFYAPTGTTTYSENTKFEVDDAASNHATGTAELTADAYDWYLLYPYSEYIKTPANTSAGYSYIGARSDQPQVQTGYNSKAHLAGGTSACSFPVYGIAKNVAGNETPVVKMKQVASVVEVKVKNESDKPVVISKVDFTAPESIVGAFYINFSEDPVTFTDYTYVSSTASLTVKDATELAVGETASFFIGIKPFAAQAGDKLAIALEVEAGSFEKEVTLSKAAEFKAGYIKSLSVSFDGNIQVEVPKELPYSEPFKGSGIGDFKIEDVTLPSGLNYVWSYDSRYGMKASAYAGGKAYATESWLVSPLIDLTQVAQPRLSFKHALNQFSSVEKAKEEATVWARVKDGEWTKLEVKYPTSLSWDFVESGSVPLTTFAGKLVQIGFKYTSTAEKAGTWEIQDFLVQDGSTPEFDVTPTQINVAATATSAEINVTGNVAWTAEASDGATVSPTSGTGAGTVTVTFPANTDANNTKEYTVFVRTDAEGVNDEFEVNITQGKAVSGNYFVKVTAAADLTDGLYLIVNEKASVALKDAVDEASNGLAVTIASDMVEATNAVKAVAFTFTASNGAFQGANGKYLAHSGTKNTINPTDTPSANTVTFSDGNAVITAEDEYFIQYNKSSGQERFRYYKSAQTDGEVQLYKLSDGVTPPPAATLESIAVSGQKTVFTVGDTFTFGGTVTASYSDGSTKDVTASAIVSNPDLSTAGTKEVTVSYTEGNVTKEANYNITVNAAVVDGKTVSMTMTEYVAANGCKISSGSDATMYKTLQLNESVRMSTTGDDNCGSFWGNDTQEWRLYQNKKGNVIVSVAEGCELKSVKLTFSATNGGVLKDAGGATVASGDKKTVSGTSVTYTVENSGTATNGQIRITAVEVVYTGDGTTFPDTPPTVITTTISMPGSQAVYIGESFSLNATSNVQGASISYESEDSSIASVNASGVVTGVAEGVVKVYARITGVEGEYTDAERYCTVTVAKKPDVVSGTWEAKALSSIADGTQFILVSTNGDGESFAMGNDNGASMAPKAISVTVNDGTLTNPASNVIFVLNKTADGYVFKMEGGETWVYCYNNNNGIRVGTTETNVFTVDSESGYLVINDGTQNRYVGVYNKQDWRAYTSVHNNIKGQTFTFFVKK